MTGNDARDEQETGVSEVDLSGRLERLGAELGAKRSAAAPTRTSSPSAQQGPSAIGQALRASTEFVAGVIVGGGLGWAIDKGLGSSPWGLIVFLLLGFGAGIYNVMRSSGFLRPASAPREPDSGR